MKGKRINKTPAQIMAEQNRIADATRLRELLKKRIYPVLLQLKSVDETQAFCTQLMGFIRQIATAMGNQIKVRDLIFKEKTLLNSLDPNDENFPHYKAVIEALGQETIDGASAIIDGFGYAIQASMRDENKKRKVSDFPNFEHHFDQ